MRSRLNYGHREILVQWAGQSPDDATWEDLEEFCQLYPSFELMGKLALEEGSDVMDSFYGKGYSRKLRLGK